MKKLLCTALASSFLSVSLAFGGSPSPVQSTARPFSLQPYAPVQASKSDARSIDFNNNYLPYFRQLINDNLSESAVFTNTEGFKLDASRLFLRTESDKTIRIYFVHDGAGYKNTVGFSMTPAGASETGTPYLIFPNASFNESDANKKGANSTKRSQTEPLVIGDFVDLSTGGPGIQLDFFLVADGAGNNNVGTWYNNKERNVDGWQHVVAFLMPNSRYVLIGFEDLYGGGDRDYNDCLFVVDIGETNAANLFDIAGTLPN